MRSARPSSSFTRRSSRELSPWPSTKASRSSSGASGCRNGTAGQHSSSDARSKSRSSRRSRRPRCAGSTGRPRAHAARRGAGEGGLGGAQEGVAVEVAHPDQRQVVRRVPAPVEAEELLAREGRHARVRPEDRRAVGMHLEHRREQRIAEHVMRVVLGAADLLEHHLDLARHLGGLEARVLHGVGQHVEAERPARPRAGWRGSRWRRRR